MARRYFTLEEANALVPTVADHMRRALQMHGLLRMAAEDLRRKGIELTHAALSEEDTTLDRQLRSKPELEAKLGESRALFGAIRDEVDAVERIGAEVKEIEIGLVDFWSYLDDGREVALCWKWGENRIDHFHTAAGGFAARKPVTGRRFFKVREDSART